MQTWVLLLLSSVLSDSFTLLFLWFKVRCSQFLNRVLIWPPPLVKWLRMPSIALVLLHVCVCCSSLARTYCEDVTTISVCTTCCGLFCSILFNVAITLKSPFMVSVDYTYVATYVHTYVPYMHATVK